MHKYHLEMPDVIVLYIYFHIYTERDLPISRKVVLWHPEVTHMQVCDIWYFVYELKQNLHEICLVRVHVGREISYVS